MVTYVAVNKMTPINKFIVLTAVAALMIGTLVPASDQVLELIRYHRNPRASFRSIS
jgi:hypothetical protein